MHSGPQFTECELGGLVRLELELSQLLVWGPGPVWRRGGPWCCKTCKTFVCNYSMRVGSATSLLF